MYSFWDVPNQDKRLNFLLNRSPGNTVFATSITPCISLLVSPRIRFDIKKSSRPSSDCTVCPSIAPCQAVRERKFPPFLKWIIKLEVEVPYPNRVCSILRSNRVEHLPTPGPIHDLGRPSFCTQIRPAPSRL